MPNFIELIAETFKDPKSVAARLLDLNLSVEHSFMAIAGSIAAYVILLFVLSGMQPITIVPGTTGFGPLGLAATVTVITALLVIAVALCGKAFQGTGTIAQSAVLFAWLQVLQVILQLAQLLLLGVSMFLAGLFALVSTIALLWVTVNFVNVLHRLDSNGKAVVVMLLAIVGLALGMSLLSGLTGFPPVPSVAA